MAETEEASGPLAEGSQQQTLSQETVVVEDQIPPPTSPFEGLLARLQDHPHDVATWQELVNIAEDSGDFVKLHDAYEALLKVYPNTVSPTRKAMLKSRPRRLHSCFYLVFHLHF